MVQQIITGTRLWRRALVESPRDATGHMLAKDTYSR